MVVPNLREWFNISAIVTPPSAVLFTSTLGLFTRSPAMSLQAEILWIIATVVMAFLVWFDVAKRKQSAQKDTELLNEIKQLVTKPETTLEDVRKAVRSAVGASAVTDTISDLYANTPLVLREEAERIKSGKERPK